MNEKQIHPDERPHCLKCSAAMISDGYEENGARKWKCPKCRARIRGRTVARVREASMQRRTHAFKMPEGGAACPKCRRAAVKLADNLFRCDRCNLIATIHLMAPASVPIPAESFKAAANVIPYETRPHCVTCRRMLIKAHGSPEKPRWRCKWCAVEFAGYTVQRTNPRTKVARLTTPSCDRCGSATKVCGRYRTQSGGEVVYFQCKKVDCRARQRSDGKPIEAERESTPPCRLCDSPTKKCGGYQPREGDRVDYYRCTNDNCLSKQRSDGMPIGVRRRSRRRVKHPLHKIIQLAARDVDIKIREDVERALASLLTERPGEVMNLGEAVKVCERKVRGEGALKLAPVSVDHEDFGGFARRRRRGPAAIRKGVSHDEEIEHEKERVEQVEEGQPTAPPAIPYARKCKRPGCTLCGVRQPGGMV
ncbi:MAG TPA: hypothetical protein VNI02_17470 [Blastocatellia bacterium]|jgi:hypothetical protein|nr:hypothetical protein [Blastocatellia bacterium]